MNIQILEQMIQHVKTAITSKTSEQEALEKRSLEISAWQNLSQFAGYQSTFMHEEIPFKDYFKNVFEVDLKELDQEQSELYSKLSELKVVNRQLSKLLTALELQLKQSSQ